MNDVGYLKNLDPEVFGAIESENNRQEQHIELIASENYASKAVMLAQGTLLTNKYAEGYPRARYYGGCEYVDAVEELAISRAKNLFNASYANVQPHSGSNANSAVFMALLKPHDKVLGMDLSAGGHLTHGAKVSFSGKIYESVTYGVNEQGIIDYDKLLEIAKEQNPKMIIAGFSAYPRVLDWSKFREIADKVGAFLLVDMAHVAGLVATGHYPNPIPFADVVTSTTHKTLRGPRGGLILSRDDTLAKKLNSSIFPGTQGGPLMHVIAAKAVCFLEAIKTEFNIYQEQVVRNSKILADSLIEQDIDIVSGGTENHLVLLNLIKNGVTGKEVDASLGRANITVNKNAVPNDPQPPFVASGIRIGTPAVTTRGFRENEMVKIANWIADIIKDCSNPELEKKIRDSVLDLCSKYPVYK